MTNDVEIDENAALSLADDGTWVAAWVWVSGDQLESVDVSQPQGE